MRRNIFLFYVFGYKRGKGVDEEFYNFMGEVFFLIDVIIFKMVDGFYYLKSCIKEF